VSRQFLRLKSFLGLLAGILLAAGLYEYGLARNRGVTPQWLDDLVFNVWPLVVIPVGIFYILRLERRVLGKLVTEKFDLLPGELILFRASLMSGVFYPRAVDFNPRPRWRELFQVPPYAVRGLLKVLLTDRRLVVGTLLGRTWRIIPLSCVRKIVDVHGSYPYRQAVLIEYDFEDQSEAILILNKSRRGQAFTDAVRSATARPN